MCKSGHSSGNKKQVYLRADRDQWDDLYIAKLYSCKYMNFILHVIKEEYMLWEW